MRKVAVLSMLASLALVVPAQATTYSPVPPTAGSCSLQEVGYRASGTLVNSTLTTTEDHHYGGTLTIDVKRTNHGAPTGEQTFTLTNARVVFHHGVNPMEPAPGSRVKLSGTITAIPSGCPLGNGNFTPTITVKKVDISVARTHGHRGHHGATGHHGHGASGHSKGASHGHHGNHGNHSHKRSR